MTRTMPNARIVGPQGGGISRQRSEGALSHWLPRREFRRRTVLISASRWCGAIRDWQRQTDCPTGPPGPAPQLRRLEVGEEGHPTVVTSHHV